MAVAPAHRHHCRLRCVTHTHARPPCEARHMYRVCILQEWLDLQRAQGGRLQHRERPPHAAPLQRGTGASEITAVSGWMAYRLGYPTFNRSCRCIGFVVVQTWIHHGTRIRGRATQIIAVGVLSIGTGGGEMPAQARPAAHAGASCTVLLSGQTESRIVLGFVV